MIDYFSEEQPESELAESLNSNTGSSPSRNRTRDRVPSSTVVNYVFFIETVLDASQLKDIKSRLLSEENIRLTSRSHKPEVSMHDMTAYDTRRLAPKKYGSRGATVSFTSPELSLDMTDTLRPNTSNRTSRLQKTTGGRYHSADRKQDSGMYSPVIGGTNAHASSKSMNISTHNKSRSYGRGDTAKWSNSRRSDMQPKEDVKLTQKQFVKAKQMKFGNQELRAIEDLKANISEALSRRPIPRGKSKTDVLREWFEIEDSNHNGALSKNSVIATLNALGLPYESWSTPSQRNLLDFLSERGGGTIGIDDIMALVGARL